MSQSYKVTMLGKVVKIYIFCIKLLWYFSPSYFVERSGFNVSDISTTRLARGVLKEDADLTKGLGMPDYQLVLCLGTSIISSLITITFSSASITV